MHGCAGLALPHRVDVEHQCEALGLHVKPTVKKPKLFKSGPIAQPLSLWYFDGREITQPDISENLTSFLALLPHL